MDKISDFLKYVENNKLYPEKRVVTGPSTNTEIVVNGKKVIIFCSSNYLSLANNQDVKKAVQSAIDKYGIGVNGSRLISGTLDIHLELERAISKYKHQDDAITFPSGFMANSGVIPALINIPETKSTTKYLINKILPNNKDVIISDELNHASIIDGCRLANAKRVVYKHNNLESLESYLKKYKDRRKLIITDGVFSMDGDIAPLPEIIKLSKEHKAILMVDDAHATGVLGKTGRGTLEHFRINDGVDVLMGTFSKAFGAIGGFVVGNQEMIDFC